MSVKTAAARTARSCVAAIDRRDASEMPKATLSHLRYMNRRIQKGEVVGDKAQRWLGWMQAVAYLCGGATHELLQRINQEEL